MSTFNIFKQICKGASFSKNVNEIDSKRNIKTEKDKVDYENESFNVKHEKDNKTLVKLAEEEINYYRNINGIKVVGRHIPPPAKCIEELNLNRILLNNARNCGYKELTAVQKQSIPVMMDNRQLLVCAPTGSGKTAAFLLPIIHKHTISRENCTLIICPTRELAEQTYKECLRLSYGLSLRTHIIKRIKNCENDFKRKYDILITTPNRLCFLLKQAENVTMLDNVEWVIIDEADKLFEESLRSFRLQLKKILVACSNENRKIGMFSATHTPVVAKWCVHNMKKLIRITIGHRNSACNSVDQKLTFVGNEQGKLLELRNILQTGLLLPPVLIFVQSKERAQQLFNELMYDGINVDAIHADRTQSQRDDSIERFRTGKTWILICTELLARGIDFKGVNLVINYDFPPSSISYIHRIGRAGRAGLIGRAITFFTTQDTANLRGIAHILKESGNEIPDYMLAIKKKSRKERKLLEKSAVKREDIKTKLVYKKVHQSKGIKEMHSNNKKLDSPSEGSKKKSSLKKKKYKKDTPISS